MATCIKCGEEKDNLVIGICRDCLSKVVTTSPAAKGSVTKKYKGGKLGHTCFNSGHLLDGKSCLDCKPSLKDFCEQERSKLDGTYYGR